MKVLSDRAHGRLDYVAIVYFAVAPSLFGFSGTPAAVFYVLAMVLLALTLSRAFRVISFRTHGAIELFVAALLIAMPLLGRYEGNAAARNVSLATAIVLGAFALLTDYRHVHEPIYERALAEAPDTESPSSDRLPSPLPPMSSPISSMRASRPSMG
ncbi:MAG: SPW repeat domain-containing protein [Polyangiales bacterium]